MGLCQMGISNIRHTYSLDDLMNGELSHDHLICISKNDHYMNFSEIGFPSMVRKLNKVF
ncbi:Uncharacterised protein [Serratia fonticola]|uniref:Uncharacterized protein n=1 Tax=Serratia fonticola TaxID=47917 RepID=A0A4U9W3V9_SERFO|nr:Uncharacterised protein [Serratia fonticola]